MSNIADTPARIDEPSSPPKLHPKAATISFFCLVSADVVAFTVAATLVFVLRLAVWEVHDFLWALWASLAAWLVFRAVFGLYSTRALAPVEEVRSSFLTCAGAALLHALVLTTLGHIQPWRLASLLIWPLAFFFGYFCRSLATTLLLQRGWYGRPALLVGAGPVGRGVLRELLKNPELGLVPVGMLSDIVPKGSHIQGVPVLGGLDSATAPAILPRPSDVIVAFSPDLPGRERIPERVKELVEAYPFTHLISEHNVHPQLLVRPRPFGSYLSLTVRQLRLSKRQRRLKRALDLVIAVPSLIVAAPVIGFFALAVKLIDPGPAFFSQVRDGRQGKPVRIWKIRSMVVNAEKKLAEHLAANPAARFEYERTLKLRHDPRVIPRVGRFIRKASIDELPQLWNVVRGDISLVGPRVMLRHEVERFSLDGQRLRRQVPPGITGLWQVLYRNNGDLQVWEQADSYYVNNWSVWMDIWIILRTFRIVLTGAGAY